MSHSVTWSCESFLTFCVCCHTALTFKGPFNFSNIYVSICLSVWLFIYLSREIQMLCFLFFSFLCIVTLFFAVVKQSDSQILSTVIVIPTSDLLHWVLSIPFLHFSKLFPISSVLAIGCIMIFWNMMFENRPCSLGAKGLLHYMWSDVYKRLAKNSVVTWFICFVYGWFS